MDDRHELIRTLAEIDLMTGILVQGIQAGLHHSVFKGQGIEFAEIREYVVGDDVRSIDWKVTARYNHPFIKEFSEEREQTFYFVVDISGSSGFGSKVSKQRKILEVMASLAFAAVRNNDRIGLLLISDRVEKYIPARSGRKHLASLFNTIIGHSPVSQKTDLAVAATFLSHVLSRRSSVVILSDFISPPFLRSLAILRRRHEIIAIRITDPRERELPDAGFIRIEDPETGEQILVDTSNEEFRSRYRALVEGSDTALHAGFAKTMIADVRLTTDEPYETVLNRFFAGFGRGKRYGRVL